MRLLRLTLVLAFLIPTAGAQGALETVLTPEATAPEIRVEGAGMALDYDGDRAALGAERSRAGTGNNLAGAVLVYERQGSDWTQMTTLISPDFANGDRFGTSVAIEGDRLAVGEPQDGDELSGAVHIFTYDGTGWTPTARLVPNSGIGFENGLFGQAVALDGDRLFVGSPGDPEPGGDARVGAVYVYAFDGAGWVQEARLAASIPVVSGDFGGALDADGDRVLVGAQASGTGGRAYVFRREAGVWSQETRLSSSFPEAGGGFGARVALDGDRALVGASREDRAAVDDGAAYVFERTGTTWTQTARLGALTGPDGNFGSSVALDGTAAVIGALGVDAGRGRAYVFQFDAGDWVQRQTLFADDPQKFELFGSAVGLVDGRAVVGISGLEDAASDPAGGAYVFADVVVADEDAPAAGGAVLSAPAPNPARGTSRLTVTVDTPQTVRAVLVDALGREVATVFDGVAVGVTEVTVDASALPPGVYVVRVTGESVSATRRLTVVR